jgi:hypothetical protein
VTRVTAVRLRSCAQRYSKALGSEALDLALRSFGSNPLSVSATVLTLGSSSHGRIGKSTDTRSSRLPIALLQNRGWRTVHVSPPYADLIIVWPGHADSCVMPFTRLHTLVQDPAIADERVGREVRYGTTHPRLRLEILS